MASATGEGGKAMEFGASTATEAINPGDVFNSVWALTDYSLENGAIAMVPGSHKYCRLPVEGEGEDVAVPVEALEGSLIVWHGNTWHGAYPKRTDGLRLNLTTYVCNRRLKPQEDFLACL